MKLGILSNNFPPEIIGGAEICAKQLSDEISKDCNIFVFAGRPNLGKRFSDYKLNYYKNNYAIYRLDLGSLALDYRNPLNFFNPIVEDKFKKIAAIERPELIHAHNLSGLSFAPIAYAKKSLKVPVIMTLHDFWLVCPKNTLLTNEGVLCAHGGISGCDGCNLYFASPLSRISMNVRNKIVSEFSKYINIYISPSKRLKDIISQKGYDLDIRCIKNGLDLESYMSIKRDEQPKGKIKILMLGRISYHKGIYIMLDALERLVKSGCTNVELILVGSIEDRYKLTNSINGKKLRNYVRVLGNVSEGNKIDIFKEADIFVLPSLWYENQPLSIIEAMASGLPVIGSNVGGIPEMICDGETGCLFMRGDSEDLYLKLEDLISNQEKRIEFGALGRTIAFKEYDIHKNTRYILELYKEIL
jgi:glycosyltransferase involved in cell wall biosynthesis